MNSGVWLLRNNDFSRRLIAEMAVYGGYPIDYHKEEVSTLMPGGNACISSVVKNQQCCAIVGGLFAS